MSNITILLDGITWEAQVPGASWDKVSFRATHINGVKINGKRKFLPGSAIERVVVRHNDNGLNGWNYSELLERYNQLDKSIVVDGVVFIETENGKSSASLFKGALVISKTPNGISAWAEWYGNCGRNFKANHADAQALVIKLIKSGNKGSAAARVVGA